MVDGSAGKAYKSVGLSYGLDCAGWARLIAPNASGAGLARSISINGAPVKRWTCTIISFDTAPLIFQALTCAHVTSCLLNFDKSRANCATEPCFQSADV